MISGSPEISYNKRVYDPFWQAAQEHNMPLALHVITGTSKESTGAANVLSGEKSEKGNVAEFYMRLIYEVQSSLSAIILGGVLERVYQAAGLGDVPGRSGRTVHLQNVW